MKNLTVEEINLLGIYAGRNKRELIENVCAALPFMEQDMRELAEKALQKFDTLTEKEYAQIDFFPADEA